MYSRNIMEFGVSNCLTHALVLELTSHKKKGLFQLTLFKCFKVNMKMCHVLNKSTKRKKLCDCNDSLLRLWK